MMRGTRVCGSAVVAGVAVGVLLPLAGCGGQAVSDAPVIAAATKSIAAKGASFSMDVNRQASGEGTVSFADQRHPTMQMTMTASGQSSAMRYVDDAYFVALTYDPGKFARVDASKVGGVVFQPITMLQALSERKADGAKVSRVEEGHWRFDPPASAPSAHSSTMSMGHDMDMVQHALDVWVGPDGYIGKVVVDMQEMGDITVSYRGWGRPVAIAAPPKDAVIPVSNGMIDAQMKAMGTLAGMGGTEMIPGG